MPSVLDEVQREHADLIADALEGYADSLRRAGDILARRKETRAADALFARAREAEFLHIRLGQM